MLICVPLVTLILPGVITPAPFENVAVRLDEAPAVIVAGVDAKLEIDGELRVAIDPSQPGKLLSPAIKASEMAAT